MHPGNRTGTPGISRLLVFALLRVAPGGPGVTSAVATRPLPTAPASSLTVPALPQGVHPLGLWLGAAGLAFPFSFTGAWLADFLYVCILLEVSPRPVSPDSLPPPRPSELPLRTSHPPHVSRLEVRAPLRSAFVVSCLKVPT